MAGLAGDFFSFPVKALPGGSRSPSRVFGLAKDQTPIPGPTDEERALQATQTQLLKEQINLVHQQNAFNDILGQTLLDQAGYQPTFDEAGNIVGLEQKPLTPTEQNAQTIENLFQQRTLAALRGDIPIDPALQRELQTQRETTLEGLRRQLGPGFETSSPGIEALRNLNESQSAIRAAARRGDLSLAEQMGLAQGQYNTGLQQTNLGTVLTGGQLPLQTIAALNGAQANAGNLASQLGQERLTQAGLTVQQNTAQANQQAQIASGIGTIALMFF